jgi:adiponectin receptor
VDLLGYGKLVRCLKVRTLNDDQILTLGTATIVFLVNPRFQGRRWRVVRVCAFVGTGLSGLVPLAHGIKLFGFSQLLERSGMLYYLGEGMLYILGAIFYTVSIQSCVGEIS